MPRQRSNAFVSRSAASPARPSPVLVHQGLIWKQLMANGFSDPGATVMTDAILAGLGLVPFTTQFQALGRLSLYDRRQTQLLRQGLAQGEAGAVALARSAAEALSADARGLQACIEMLQDFIDQALDRLVSAGDRFNALADGVSQAMGDRSGALAQARFGA